MGYLRLLSSIDSTGRTADWLDWEYEIAQKDILGKKDKCQASLSLSRTIALPISTPVHLFFPLNSSNFGISGLNGFGGLYSSNTFTRTR